MSLFTLTGSFSRLKEAPFKQEKEMQQLVESQLPELFGLQFVASEFAPHNHLRIDTLAYDPEQKSFVIIEYKNGGSWSVVDQGFSYLSLLLNNKADFVLKFQKCGGKNCDIADINWEASQVIFIAPSFNVYQTEAVGFQNMPFQLWEIRRHEKGILALNRLQTAAKAALPQMSLTKEAQQVQKEVKSYSVDSHFKPKWTQSRELFDELFPELLKLHPDFAVKPVKYYIGIKLNGDNVFSLHVYKGGITLNFPRSQPRDFKDPQKRVKEVKNSMKYYGQHISWLWVKEQEDIPYALMLAKQALKKY
ncbi:MAG: DUF5655 domain-containing protein [Candidatus Peribacteraceae bacterium]|nr:DUF5655 domain-containing protein [Candidatus Peribacteraceae bacterium]